MTTIVAVRKDGKQVIGADGQVSLGDVAEKNTGVKLVLIGSEEHDNIKKVVAGFAGSAADGHILCEILKKKVSERGAELRKAVTEMAKDWRKDKFLRQLNARMLVIDGKEDMYAVGGDGCVLAPEIDVMTTGSGGHFAKGAAVAMLDKCPAMSAEDIVSESLKIAGQYDSHSNGNFFQTISQWDGKKFTVKSRKILPDNWCD